MKRKKAGKIKELPDIVAVDNLSTRSKGGGGQREDFCFGEAAGIFCLELEGEVWNFRRPGGKRLWNVGLVRYTGERRTDRN